MTNVILKRNYESTITEPLGNETTWEIPVYLSVPPDSQMWFLIIEPWVLWQEESIFHHKVIWNVAYVYWINRTNPVLHSDNARVVLSNSIDYLNYAIWQTNEQTYIYKKDTQNIVCKWGSFYIWSNYVILQDLDTQDALPLKSLIAGSLNYIYIKDYDYYISTTVEAWLFLVATIDVSIWWIVGAINKMNTYSIWTKWEQWVEWIQWIPWYPLILRQSSWYMQWALDNWTPVWENLVALIDIQWPEWESANFQVDLTWTWLQYKFPSDLSWTNIIAMSELKWDKWDPWDIWNPWPEWQQISENTTLKSWWLVEIVWWNSVKITQDSGLYTMYTTSWITSYSVWDEALLSKALTWTFDTPVMTYEDWMTVNWTTWLISFTWHPAYADKDNTFTWITTFNWPAMFNSDVTFPPATMSVITNNIIFDWSKSRKQVVTLSDTNPKTISFVNMKTWGNFEFAIITTGSTTLSKWTVSASGDIVNISTLRDPASPATDWLPLTMTGPDVYIFVWDVYNTAVHLSVSWVSRSS